MRRHMIALDGKKQAEYAFEWYLENVWREGDQVCLVHCSPFQLHVGMPGVAVNVELVSKQVKDAKDRAEAILQTGNELLRNKSIKGYTVLKTGLKAEEGILQAAQAYLSIKLLIYTITVPPCVSLPGIKGYTVLKTGLKAEEGILQAAQEEQADHLFMGTRELSGLQRALVGSVSTFVVRHARVPVTIVKMPHAH
ncbi:hypothetical protein EGW08_001692 [Elysia chlorotica]|uniref:UspA domain-containing protein n=1 Tax=Elysia chlorotica TaxID=188477 RepID=A0A3S1BSV5_ELYCH|nr:hypothetical protein EGW08_001692 [Elysia chlorotica]